MPEIIVKLGDNIVQNYLFTDERIGIGRAPDNDIVIENLAVSRNHAVITHEDGRYYLEDLGSSNGSYINGVKIHRNEVADRDVITIGKHKIYFYDRLAREPVRRIQPSAEERTMIVQHATVGELVVTKGRQKDEVFVLNGPCHQLGRGGQNDIRLTDWFVSKSHAQIEKRGDGYYLIDLGSWRHTMVNGEIVNEALLKEGDTIQLGPTVQLQFRFSEHLEQVSAMRRYAEAEREAEGKSVEEELDLLSESIENEPTRLLPTFAPDPAIRQEEGSGLADWADAVNDVISMAEDQADQPVAANRMNGTGTNGHVAKISPSPMISGDLTGDAVQSGCTSDTGDAAMGDSPANSPIEGSDVCSGGEAAGPTHAEAPMADGTGPAGPGECVEHDECAVATESPASPAACDKPHEVRMWERALANKSPVIRRQAARMLKKLTGIDYDH